MSYSKFITTTIPYVNANPHVGFALELVQADAYARYRRLKGDDLCFQSGTDENSLKNVFAAREKATSVEDHVNEHSQVFRRLSEQLEISLDQFVRTTSEIHHQTTKEIWSQIKEADLYRKSYSGKYCVGCEDFLQDADLVEGLCRDHTAPLEWIEEENVFFRLSSYQSRLVELIASDRIRITPSFRKKEILNFISGGLHDISVSRDRRRSHGWGVTVPNDENQVVYVWIDALINYISGFTDSPAKSCATWNEVEHKTHFIGKNVWKFHAVYWPALLLSCGLDLPDEIVIHGFLTLDGNKISKSQGISIDPFALIREFGADSVRFYLLRAFSPFDDGDFSIEALKESHNAYLANGLGNLLSRLTTLAARLEIASSNLNLQPTEYSALDEALKCYRFDEAIKLLWQDIDRINQEVAAEKPWELGKIDRASAEKRVTEWLEELWSIVRWAGVFVPDASERADHQIRNLGIKHAHLFERKD